MKSQEISIKKIGKEDIFKSTVNNQHSHKISNENEVTAVKFATSKNLSRVHCSHNETHKCSYVLWVGRCTVRLITYKIQNGCDTDHYLIAAEAWEKLSVS
jgi:hypothetical protein